MASHGQASPGTGRQRVVIVGGGFAGFHAARRLARRHADSVEVTVVNPTDYFLYLPLLPEVAGGILDPRQIAVPLTTRSRGVKHLLGTVTGADLAARTLEIRDPEGGARTISYDQVVFAAGSVNKLLPIPGVADNAHGFRSVAEAVYLRDHLLRQVELADAADDRAERDARCTFVVVGAGYTGTEVAAHGQLLTRAAIRRRPGLHGVRPRWLLIDVAPRVLPGLDQRLSRTAERVLTGRGVQIRTETSVEHASPDGVKLSDGEFVATRSLIWCVGVRPDPLIESLGLPVSKGRLVTDEYLTVPGHPEIHACGDAAAVPDITRPGQLTAMTAQHAERQGKTVAHNVAASAAASRTASSAASSQRRRYKHHDLGFVVDLAGARAAANPLGVPLSGPVAKAVTRGYHLLSIPANRVRIAADWLIDAMSRRQTVQLGMVRSGMVPLTAGTPERPHPPSAPAPKPDT